MNSIYGGYVFIPIIFWVSVGAILYTYFGYPLLITLAARFSSKPDGGSKPGNPSVTLMIAAYNEEKVIENKLKNSLGIDYPSERLQILVVTDGSSDSTPVLVQNFAKDGVLLLHEAERRGKMAAIDRAMPYTEGEIVVFSDANNHYRPDAIRKLVTPFSDPEVGAVSGAKLIDQQDDSLGASEGLYWKYESFIKRQESRLGSCTSASGEILAIRKILYRKPPQNVINDDFYMAMQIVRQGYRFVYVPEAISYEKVSPSAQDEIVRRTRINAGRYQAIALARETVPFDRPVLVWQIVSHKFLRPLVPFFMISALVSNLLAVAFPIQEGGLPLLAVPYGAIFLSTQIVFYIMAWIGTRFTAQGKQSKIMKLLYLPAFLTNSNFAALKGLVKFMRGGQFHIWERIQRG